MNGYGSEIDASPPFFWEAIGHKHGLMLHRKIMWRDRYSATGCSPALQAVDSKQAENLSVGKTKSYWTNNKYVYRTIQYLPCDQYSSGSMRIVAERSASVRIQILSPALVVYADRMRNPCSTASSFSRLSSSGTSPQSPLTWLGSDKARSEQARFLIAPV